MECVDVTTEVHVCCAYVQVYVLMLCTCTILDDWLTLL